MRSIALRSQGWIIVVLVGLLSILVNTMPAQATIVYSTDPLDTGRGISATGIIPEGPSSILADFDITRRVVLGTTSAGLEKFVQVAQRSILRDAKIEVACSVSGDNIFAAPGPNITSAQSIANIGFTITEETTFTAVVVGQTPAGGPAGAGVVLSRANGTTVFTSSLGDQTVQGTLQPGFYQLSVGASLISPMSGPFEASTSVVFEIPAPSAVVGLVAAVAMTGAARRRNQS